MLFTGLGPEGPSDTYGGPNSTVVRIIQGYFTAFVETGDPNAGNAMTGAPRFVNHDSQHALQFGNKVIRRIVGPSVNIRCRLCQLTSYH